jgi:hypothetical protein
MWENPIVRGAHNGMDREASVISWKKLRVAITSHVAVATVCDVATLSTRETTMYPARVASRHRRDFFKHSSVACGVYKKDIVK